MTAYLTVGGTSATMWPIRASLLLWLFWRIQGVAWSEMTTQSEITRVVSLWTQKPILMWDCLSISRVYYWDSLFHPTTESLFSLNTITFLSSAGTHRERSQAVVKFGNPFEKYFVNVKWQSPGHKSTVLLLCLKLGVFMKELPVSRTERKM